MPRPPQWHACWPKRISIVVYIYWWPARTIPPGARIGTPARTGITDLTGNGEAGDGTGDKEGAHTSIRQERVATAQRMIDGVPIGYVLFNTKLLSIPHPSREKPGYDSVQRHQDEAFNLLGLDSLNYERAHYGHEYNHYLSLSYAISELVRYIAHSPEEATGKYSDRAVSEFAKSVLPKVRVSLHCHEFGVFYAAARLKKLGFR